MLASESKLALGRLTASVKELGKASMAFETQLATIEQGLQRLNLGLDGSAETTWTVPCMPKEKQPQRSYWRCSLAFRKHGEDWRLLVNRVLYVPTVGLLGFKTDNLRGEAVPLMDTTRDTRLGSAPAVLEIIEDLQAQVATRLNTFAQLATVAPGMIPARPLPARRVPRR